MGDEFKEDELMGLYWSLERTHNEGRRNVYFLPDVIWAMNSRKMN